MKKIYLTFLIAAFASAAWAQDTPKKPSFAGFVSNGFWDNWEISVGAGAGTAFSNGSNLKSFGDRHRVRRQFLADEMGASRRRSPGAAARRLVQ